MSKTRSAAYRQRKNRKKELKRQAAHRGRPFVAVDGEGITNKATGRHDYMLLCIGNEALYTGKPLTSVECLEFICMVAPSNDDALLTSFAFGYDVSMILRDLPAERLSRILMDTPFQANVSRYTYWKDFAIEYLQRNYLRVARTKRVFFRDASEAWPQVIPGTARTIYDSFGFFQGSFAATIADWKIGTQAERDMIGRMKENRSEFAAITSEIIAYCKMENRMLGELMTATREVCTELDIIPPAWSGAGKLAAALHDKHDTMRRGELAKSAPAGVLRSATAAYYGGRFEITCTGLLPPVHAYDINSAFPAAMLDLPCLECGKWKRVDKAELGRLERRGGLFVASVRFTHGTARKRLCGLPTRLKTGRLVFPSKGSGVYWSSELRSARKLGCRISYLHGWKFSPGCDHKPFAWVAELYRQRLALGKTTRGTMLKLGINALYGKLAQRVGNGAFANPIWAGLITATVRARLNEAIALAPDSIVMLATDAVFSFKPLDLPVSDRLGDWDVTRYPRLFVVQPGLYWGPEPTDGKKRKLKRRGVPLKFFEAIDPVTDERRTDTFERVWREYCESETAAVRLLSQAPPSVPLPMTLFVSVRLAMARRKLDTACQWVTAPRNISFDWRDKRAGLEWCAASNGPVTFCRHWSQTGPVVSLAYDAAGKLVASLDLDALELQDQPEWLDVGTPWKV
jgi:DNA polymerase type B, organellar and viral